MLSLKKKKRNQIYFHRRFPSFQLVLKGNKVLVLSFTMTPKFKNDFYSTTTNTLIHIFDTWGRIEYLAEEINMIGTGA